MEDPGEEWEIGRYSTSGSGEEVCESNINRILKGGLWLGKKFVITGFVISSAPVVLPPLVVVSALGFAVSIPFGVVLAGYTCTEKLMNKLLPMPESSGMLDYGRLVNENMEENGEGEGEFAMEEEEKAQIQDTKESVEMRIELAEDGNKDQQQENVIPEMDPNSGRNVTIEDRSEDSLEGSMTKGSEDEKRQVVVTRVVVAKPIEGETESAAAGKGEDAEVLKAESTGLLQKVRDESKSGESTKKNKKKNKDRQKKSVGLGLGGKKEDKIAKDAKEMEKNSGINITEEGNKNIEISGEMTKHVVLNAPVVEKPVESQNTLINGNDSEGKANFVNEEQARLEHLPVESNTIRRENTGNRVPHKVEAAKASTKISPSEKNLWEQINAVRIIVGYKAVPQPSLAEELKALYMFTGVEPPPSSFQDITNIRDAEDKLRFLMSIVGVK